MQIHSFTILILESVRNIFYSHLLEECLLKGEEKYDITGLTKKSENPSLWYSPWVTQRIKLFIKNIPCLSGHVDVSMLSWMFATTENYQHLTQSKSRK